MKNLCSPSTMVWTKNPASTGSWAESFHAFMGYRPEGVKRIRMKCPTCGRKVLSSVSVCHDGCCILHSIPPHKPKHWWKKGKKLRK